MSPRPRPRVIADSDDEDCGGYSPPASPQAQLTIEPDLATRSSDHPSHETSSTDLMFFQSVYKEQNDAAEEQAHKIHHGHTGDNGANLGIDTGT